MRTPSSSLRYTDFLIKATVVNLTVKTNKSWLVIFTHVVCMFLSRLMWAAQLKAPLLTQCVLSSHGTLVPRGTSWFHCVQVDHSPPRFAPQSFTLPVSISLALLRAGEGRSFSLANSASVGKDYNGLNT